MAAPLRILFWSATLSSCRDRIHCYVFTGPLFLFAAVFVALSGLGVVTLHPGLFLLIVLGACCLAQCAEIPLGRYRKGEQSRLH